MNNDCVMCVDLYINEFLRLKGLSRICETWMDSKINKRDHFTKTNKSTAWFFIIIILPVLVSSLMVIL